MSLSRGGSALRFTLLGAEGVMSAPDGTIFVADWGNSRVRRIAPDGTITTYAGGAGSKKGGVCGLGAGEDDMATWAAFTVANARARSNRITVKLVTTLPALVTVRITQGGTTVARVSRRVNAGTPTVVIRKRLRAGRYRVVCAGRGPRNLRSSSVSHALRVSR